MHKLLKKRVWHPLRNFLILGGPPPNVLVFDWALSDAEIAEVYRAMGGDSSRGEAL